MLGFFTCGFQLGFVTVHLPAYLIDRGLSAEIGGWTLGVIGLFNIVGAMLSGWLGGRMPKRYILSFIYFARALAVVFLITLPASPAVTLIYGAVTGLLWLSIGAADLRPGRVMFGTRWLAMLFGVAFFSHQVGGFLGVYLGGVLYERTGSYDVVWWLGVLFGVLSALINLPIVEKPVQRAPPRRRECVMSGTRVRLRRPMNLVPGIHVLHTCGEDVDGRDKSGRDEREASWRLSKRS